MGARIPKTSTNPRGAGHRSTTEEILKRRATVSEMYLAGRTVYEIALAVDVSHSQVTSDLKRIREIWRSSAVRNFDEAKSLELARIDQVELEAWRGWHRSVGRSLTLTERNVTLDGVQESDAGTKQQVRVPAMEHTRKTEKLSGDPRFLDIVNKCIGKRCEILGLNAPVKQEHSGAIAIDGARERILGELARIAERKRAGTGSEQLEQSGGGGTLP